MGKARKRHAHVTMMPYGLRDAIDQITSIAAKVTWARFALPTLCLPCRIATAAQRIGCGLREILQTREFWSNVTAAMIGTVAAALLGIVVAFWYDGYKRDLERSDREKTFLERIYCELSGQQKILALIATFDPTTVGNKPALNLNTAFWEASKGTDYILAVNDPAVLNSIARAYQSLANVDHLISRQQDFFYLRPDARELEMQYAYAQLIHAMKVQADEAGRLTLDAANKAKAQLSKTKTPIKCQ